MTVKQRISQANYLEIGETPAYEFMGLGFTDLNEAPSAKTKSKQYINQKSATQSVVGYEWKTPFTTDVIKDEVVVSHICKIGKNQLIGAVAEANYCMVDLDELAVEGTPNVFNARQIKVAIAVSDFGNEDGEMTASGDLLGIGDIVLGTFATLTKTFTATTV